MNKFDNKEEIKSALADLTRTNRRTQPQKASPGVGESDEGELGVEDKPEEEIPGLR